MDIRGETIQNGEPSPEHPVEIENKTNILLAIEILKKLKSKVTLVEADEKEYRLPFLMNIEQQAIDTVLSELEKQDNKIKELEGRCRNLDKEAQSYLEELMGDSTFKNRTIKQLNLELEKKDKQIDLMAEQLAGLAIFDIEKDEPLILGDKEEVKQYFKEKVEG